MDLADEIGRGQVQLVVAAVDEDALVIEHSTHGAVGDHDAPGKLLAKRLYSGDNTCCRHDSLQRSEPGYLKRDAKTLYVQILPVLLKHRDEEDARRFCSWNGG